MYEILSKRLGECNTTINDILNLLEKRNNITVIIYISAMDQFGSKHSDFDVYVICDNDEIESDRKINKRKFVNDLVTLDIEYFSYKYVDNLINNINRITRDDIKFLYRMRRGYCALCNSSFKNLKDRLEWNDIKQALINNYLLSTKSILEDCTVMYDVEDYLTSIMLGRLALGYAYSAKLALYDDLIFKEKWLVCALKRCPQIDESEYLKFVQFQLFSIENDNLKKYAEEIIAIIQDTISYVNFNV